MSNTDIKHGLDIMNSISYIKKNIVIMESNVKLYLTPHNIT